MSDRPIRAEASPGGLILAFLDAPTARLLADAVEFAYAERALDPVARPTYLHDVAALRRAAISADGGRQAEKVVHPRDPDPSLEQAEALLKAAGVELLSFQRAHLAELFGPTVSVSECRGEATSETVQAPGGEPDPLPQVTQAHPPACGSSIDCAWGCPGCPSTVVGVNR